MNNTMEFYEYLDKIEEVGSTIDKVSLLAEMIRTHPAAEKFLRFAFNDTVYGLSEKSFYNAFDAINDANYEHVSDFLFAFKNNEDVHLKLDHLYELGRELASLTGQNQLNRIYNEFSDLNSTLAKWWSRTILHDLRCGVQVKTVNTALKACGLKQIKKFSMQLAKKLDIDDEDDVAKKLTFPCSMETKYDGIRIQAHVWVENEQTMSCQLTSRRGKDRTSLHPEICAALCEKFEGQNVILDCEVVANSFQQLTRKGDKSIRRLVIWDILNDEGLPYKNRWDNLLNLLSSVGITEDLFSLNNNIINNNITAAEQKETILLIAEHYSCNNLEELREFYRDMNRRKEEGVIVKLDNAVYKRGSRTNMFKIKKVYTADLKIIGFKYGEGKRAGMVSTLELEDVSGELRVDVGSGIDDYTSDDLTQQIEEHMQSGGHESEIPFLYDICEIKYNELTETGSIRFPRFICIRDDKETPDHKNDLVTR